jgi:hypothetical protein
LADFKDDKLMARAAVAVPQKDMKAPFIYEAKALKQPV